MSVTELKEKLHNRIEAINDQNQLKKILSVVENTDPYNDLTEDEIRLLEERHEKYLSGEEKEVTAQEFKAQMKDKYGF